MSDHSNGVETVTDDSAIRDEIIARLRKREPGKEIAADLKVRGILGYSPATISRIRKDEIGAQRARKRSKVAALPATPADIPADAPIADLDWWLKLAELEARKAQTEGNIAMIGNMARLATAIHEAKRKAAPEPKPDP